MKRILTAMLVIASSSALGLCAESYAPVKGEEVRTQILLWVAGKVGPGSDSTARVAELWSDDSATQSPERLLELTVQSFAIVDPATNEFVASCRLVNAPLLIPSIRPLVDQAPDFYAANLQLYFARYLVDRQLYDDAISVLAKVDPHKVIDPASYFFLKSVASQGILDVETALESLDRLTTKTENVPLRYTVLAGLMKADLEGLKGKPLNEIAKLMNDSERRLDLGQAGDKTQQVQERIIANLDELIKKMEQQSGGGGGGGGGSSGNNPSGAADDSSVKGSTAPGLTDPKKFAQQGGWGNLPDKEQADAKNILNRNFPSHYQQAVEQYFKKLANRPARKDQP